MLNWKPLQQCAVMQAFVRDNDVNAALRVLKKTMQREGTFRDMKRRRPTKNRRNGASARRPKRSGATKDAAQAARTRGVLRGRDIRRMASEAFLAISERHMAAHKFSVGQSVRFSPDRNQQIAAQGRFIVVRLLPEAASIPQYRVKSQLDGHERVVREDQLARL
jgi:small subunit ribosomal protein S21